MKRWIYYVVEGVARRTKREAVAPEIGMHRKVRSSLQMENNLRANVGQLHPITAPPFLLNALPSSISASYGAD
jgi:hypothetical protein